MTLMANSGYNVARLAAGIEAGNSSSTPFGGVKDSGLGREDGIQGQQSCTAMENG